MVLHRKKRTAVQRLRLMDLMVGFILIIGVLAVVFVLTIAMTGNEFIPEYWRPLFDRGNFVAESWALFIEATILAVVLGYVVPERMRQSQAIEEAEKWLAVRFSIYQNISRIYLKSNNIIHKALEYDEKNITFNLHIKTDPQQLKLFRKQSKQLLELADETIKLLERYAVALTPEISSVIVNLDSRLRRGVAEVFAIEDNIEKIVQAIRNNEPGVEQTVFTRNILNAFTYGNDETLIFLSEDDPNFEWVEEFMQLRDTDFVTFQKNFENLTRNDLKLLKEQFKGSKLPKRRLGLKN